MRDKQRETDAARQSAESRPDESEIQDLTSEENKPTKGGEAKGGLNFTRKIQDSED